MKGTEKCDDCGKHKFSYITRGKKLCDKCIKGEVDKHRLKEIRNQYDKARGKNE